MLLQSSADLWLASAFYSFSTVSLSVCVCVCECATMSSLFKPSFNFGSKKKDNEDDEYSFGNDTLDPMSQYSNLAHLQGPLVGADKV